MTKPPATENHGSSTRPYLIRALHDWCVDNGFTPYVAVFVDARVQVPMEYVKNNEIVLNIGFEATTALKLGNEFIEFKARFGGAVRDIVVPVDHVVAIYARENGQGMAFPVPTGTAATPSGAATFTDASSEAAASQRGSLRLARADSERGADAAAQDSAAPPPDEPPEPPSRRPPLKRVK